MEVTCNNRCVHAICMTAFQSAHGQVESWHWQEIMKLEIENIADSPSFVFLWCVHELVHARMHVCWHVCVA